MDKCSLRRKAILAIIYILLPALAAPASAASVSSGTTDVPPLRYCKSTPERDLGVWDDIFVCEEQNLIALRRGDTLFSLSMTGSPDPIERTKASAARGKKIVGSVGLGDRLWLLMHGGDTDPCAVDLYSGQLATFDIPVLREPGTPSPRIESHVSVPHAGGVVVKVLEVGRSAMPRYFWMSLRSGEVVGIPLGGELCYFSADQRIAVFWNPLRAIDMATGGLVDTFPDRDEAPHITPSRYDTEDVAVLSQPRKATEFLGASVGFSVRGLVLLVDVPPEETRDVPTAATEGTLPGVRLSRNLRPAKEEDGYIGFRNGHGDTRVGGPSPLWLVALKQHSDPELLATAVADFVMLRRGNCIFIMNEGWPQATSVNVFFYDHGNDSTWDLLTGVQRPGLDKEIIDKYPITNESTVRLIEGFGDQENALVLCRFSHVQTAGSPSLPIFTPDGKCQQTTWRCAILVTSDGKRFMTDLFREGGMPRDTWLHNSGKVIIVRDAEQSSSTPGEQELRLSEITLQLQDARE